MKQIITIILIAFAFLFVAADGQKGNVTSAYQIEQKLKSKVLLRFTKTPLSKVLKHLADTAKVKLHLDLDALKTQGYDRDPLVTINLEVEITTKSALNLILRGLDLDYLIKDDGIHIVSERVERGPITRTYDLSKIFTPINDKDLAESTKLFLNLEHKVSVSDPSTYPVPFMVKYTPPFDSPPYKVEPIPNTTRIKITLTRESHKVFAESIAQLEEVFRRYAAKVKKPPQPK